MKYLLLPLLTLAALCPTAFGQSSFIKSDLITAPDSVPAGSTIVVQIQGDLPYTIDPKPGALIRLRDDDGNRVLLIQGAVSPGYEIKVDFQVIHPTEEELAAAPTVPDPKDAAQVKAFKEYFKSHSRDEFFQDSHTVKVGTGPKPPDPPTPPDPPVPPDVEPPIPGPGFRVLFIIDDKDTLPVLQQAILAGEETDAYLKQACIDEPGGSEGWRVYDKDADLTNELPVWREAHKRRPKDFKTPWVIVSNGKTGVECPLPASPSAFIELCRKYEVK